MKGLDLRKFKKLHANENTTTLAHPDGHQIKIAHSRLKPEHRAELEKLPKFAEGGLVDRFVDVFKEPEKKHSKPVPQIDPNKAKEMSKAFGNTRPKFAAGGVVDSELTSEPASLNNLGVQTDVMKMSPMAFEGMPVEKSAREKAESFAHKDSDNLSGILTPENEGQQQVEPSTAPVQQSNNLGDSSMAPQDNMPMGLMAQNPIMGAMTNEMQGVRKEAAAVGEQGRQEAAAAQEQVSNAQKLHAEYNTKASEIQNEIANVTHDYMNGHIDPGHFWNSQSNTSKIMSTIGLLLGGIGGGLTHQENPALKFLNSQIDRDIDSQKAEMGKKHNLISALNQQLGNLGDATKMAKAMYADIYSAKIMDAAAKSKDPIAQARAQQAIGHIQQAVAPMIQDVAMRQAAFSGVRAGHVSPEQAVPLLVPKEHQNKALEELKDYEVHKKSSSLIDKAFSDLSNLQSTGNRLTNPIQSKSQIGAINLQLDSLAKELFGKVSDQEIHLLNSSHVGLLDSDATVNKKRQVIQGILQKNMASPTLKAYGIKLPELHSSKVTKRAGYGK